MIKFSDDKMQKVQEIIARYPDGKQKSALLPLLHLAQETFGWLSSETMDYVAELLNIKPIEVYEVATFYSMYNTKPVGKYVDLAQYYVDNIDASIFRERVSCGDALKIIALSTGVTTFLSCPVVCRRNMPC